VWRFTLCKGVTTLVKNPCIYKNIRPQSWETYSKLNGEKKHPSGMSLKLVMAKEMAKTLERKNGIYWNFTYENKGN